VKWLKLLIAILLLPACAAITLAAVGAVRQLLPTATDKTSLAFLAGYGLWLLIFVVLPKPTRTYVLGHELTHAFWALLMGARVSNLEVGKTGGQVETTKMNWLIALAPYFFPFYAMLFMLLFFIAHLIWNLTPWFWVLFLLVGFGWSFHVTFTLMLLFTTGQPDVKSQGYLFSAVVIYTMNLLTMLVTATALSPALHFADLAINFWRGTIVSYGWTLDKLVALWQHLQHAIRH
jgi:hypothetical protein